MSHAVILLLRSAHILSGGLWVGVAVFNAAYLFPAVVASGASGGQVMRVIARDRRLPVFIRWVMNTAIFTGAGLYGWTSNGFQWEWILSRTGLAFTFGAVLAIVTAALTDSVTIPTVRRLGQLGEELAASGEPKPPQLLAEQQAAQRKLLAAARLGATFVVMATLLMAVARYL